MGETAHRGAHVHDGLLRALLKQREEQRRQECGCRNVRLEHLEELLVREVVRIVLRCLRMAAMALSVYVWCAIGAATRLTIPALLYR